jgi:hypothetical protein
MATSGVTDWPLTVGEIVRQAMIELGVLNSGDQPDAPEMSDGITKLTAMLKSWSLEANLFREESGTVTVTGASGGVTLEAEVAEVYSVRHVVSATNQRPLPMWNREQYYFLPNRSQAGNPTICYIARNLDTLELRLWPVPATDVDLHLDYGRSLEVPSNPDETLDLPQAWQEAVIMGLASRLASMFGATRIDPATVQRVDSAAGSLYARVLDHDRPDSIYMEPWGA